MDRGHVVRRDDSSWGTSPKLIEYANSDTFHWTNCTPQHEAFNQSDPGRNDGAYAGMKGLWGDFENHIVKELEESGGLATLFAGPVLNNEKDPSADFGSGDIQYPLMFWKVVAVIDGEPSAENLQVFGFVFDQSDVVERFGIEARFAPDKIRQYQVSLGQITRMTGVIFAHILYGRDVKRAEPNARELSRVDESLRHRSRTEVAPNPVD
jgi:endonuclease G